MYKPDPEIHAYFKELKILASPNFPMMESILCDTYDNKYTKEFWKRANDPTRPAITRDDYYRLKHRDLDASLIIGGAQNAVHDEVTLCWVKDHPQYFGKEILDAGCEDGHITCCLAKLFPESHITGIDCRQDSIRLAKQLAKRLGLKNVDFKVADYMKTEVTTGTDLGVTTGTVLAVTSEVTARTVPVVTPRSVPVVTPASFDTVFCSQCFPDSADIGGLSVYGPVEASVGPITEVIRPFYAGLSKMVKPGGWLVSVDREACDELVLCAGMAMAGAGCIPDWSAHSQLESAMFGNRIRLNLIVAKKEGADESRAASEAETTASRAAREQATAAAYYDLLYRPGDKLRSALTGMSSEAFLRHHRGKPLCHIGFYMGEMKIGELSCCQSQGLDQDYFLLEMQRENIIKRVLYLHKFDEMDHVNEIIENTCESYEKKGAWCRDEVTGERLDPN